MTEDKRIPDQRKVRNYLINPRVQFRYILWTTMTGILLVIMNAAFFWFHMSENYQILVDLSPMTDAAKEQLYRELYHAIFELGAGSIVFLIIVSLVGIIFTHRTIGPLYHFNKIFGLIRKGDTSARIHLRQRDDFREIAENFNGMMDDLTKRR